MTIGQYSCSEQNGGVLRSQPAVNTAADQAIALSHAMSRSPELAYLKLTNIVADNGWTPGEVFHLYQSTITSPGFVIGMNGGLCNAYIEGGSLTGVLKTGAHTTFVLTVGSWKLELVCLWFAPILPSL